MDKINNISFTGIKNIADISYQKSNSTISSALSMVLTDDFKGKDLTEFKAVLEKVAKKSKNFRHKDGVEFLNLEKCENRYDTNIKDSIKFYLNGKEIEVKDENLPIFSYLAKLTRKISNMDSKDMVVNNDYKNYEIGSKLKYDFELDKEQLDELKRKNLLDRIFNRTLVKSSADATNKLIQTVMENYFK